jgi:hypothetical protein
MEPPSKNYGAPGEVDLRLNRLMRSASSAEDAVSTAPFGFDTRVVAQWRAGANAGNGNGVARLVRRVALLAAAVIVVSTAGTVRELQRSQASGEPFTNEFAIADSAIENEILP